jgi:glycosyltransferase involved in cell wall biosynthesis
VQPTSKPEMSTASQRSLSIITVSYNAAPTIERTIRSVLCQAAESDWNVEYVVIDGGSTDGTVDIIQSFDHQIDYWVSEADRGIYDAMNKGIARVTGEWVGVLNSDDWYAREAFSHLRKEIESNPQVDVVVGGVVRVTEDGTAGKLVLPPHQEFSALRPNNHPATFVKRDVYEQIGGFDLDYDIAADIELILRVQATPNLNIGRSSPTYTYMQEGGASSGMSGIVESARIERQYRGALSAGRVLLRKLYQKGRRKLMQGLIPDTVVAQMQEEWWRRRRNHVAVTQADYWCQTDRN